VILSAAYALWLYRRVVFGDLGVYPSLITDMIGPSVEALLTTNTTWRSKALVPFRGARSPRTKGPKATMLGPDLAVILPEIVLSLFAMGALLGAVYTGKDGSRPR
jgi:hypothetical protein